MSPRPWLAVVAIAATVMGLNFATGPDLPTRTLNDAITTAAITLIAAVLGWQVARSVRSKARRRDDRNESSSA